MVGDVAAFFGEVVKHGERANALASLFSGVLDCRSEQMLAVSCLGNVPIHLELTVPPASVVAIATPLTTLPQAGGGALGAPPHGPAPLPAIALGPGSPTPPGMCEWCKIKPSSPGFSHCNRSCATAAAAAAASWAHGAGAATPATTPAAVACAATAPCPSGMCPFCHTQGIPRPVFAGQAYCGKTCATNAQQKGWVAGVPPSGGATHSGGGGGGAGMVFPTAGGKVPCPTGMCPFCHSRGTSRPVSSGQVRTDSSSFHLT